MASLMRVSKNWLITIAEDFFSLFFPNYCLGCNDALVRGEDILCTHCLSELPKVDYLSAQENPIVNRFIGRVPVQYGWSLFKFQKSGIVQKLLHGLKYGNRPEIGEKLGRVLGNHLVRLGLKDEFDIIVPVPLHKNRKRFRGYNQSALIAKGISEVLGKPFSDEVMYRVTATQTQTKKSKVERWESMNNAFQIQDSNRSANKKILLVDDVITTGATTEACAKALIREGALTISIVCLAEVL